jgi:hypothetical protein
MSELRQPPRESRKEESMGYARPRWFTAANINPNKKGPYVETKKMKWIIINKIKHSQLQLRN